MRIDIVPPANEGDRLPEGPLYPVLNIAFHGFHAGIILFTLFGWAFQSTRFANLILILLMLGSWYILGIWFGEGYCPVTECHWKIRRKMRNSRISDSYIKLVLDKLTGRDLDSRKVSVYTLVITLTAGAVSLVMNIRDFL